MIKIEGFTKLIDTWEDIIMKNNKKAFVVFLTALLISGSVVCGTKVSKEDDSRSPLGCLDVGYRFDLKVLDLLPKEAGDRQSLYFIYNRLQKDVSLYQMLKDDSSRSMPLNHMIHAEQWAVLSTGEKNLKYVCTVKDEKDAKSTYGKVVDCADSIKVCEFARVKYGLNNRGNFWLVNSNTRGGAVQEVLHYGIIPR